MLPIRYLTALALTLAVEVPLYAVLLSHVWRVPWRRSVAVAVGVNLVTHPPLWWLLLPLAGRPWYGGALLAAEAAACVGEWLLLRAWLARRDRALLALSVAVNAGSALVGLLAAGLIGSAG